MERTDQQIVEQTDMLARAFAQNDGWRIDADVHSYDSENPRIRRYWRMACIAQEFLTGTDVSVALQNWQDEQY